MDFHYKPPFTEIFFHKCMVWGKNIWVYVLRISFHKIVLHLQHDYVENMEVSQSLHMYYYHYLFPELYICYSWWTYLDTLLLPKVYNFNLRFLVVLYVEFKEDLDKCRLTCIHHCNTTQFHCLKILCLLSFYSLSSHTQPLINTIFLTLYKFTFNDVYIVKKNACPCGPSIRWEGLRIRGK